MRYNHFDMLPEKAFQPVGKRMTLEGGGAGKAVSSVGKAVGGVGNVVGSAVGSLGGPGNVLGPAIQLGFGASPLGVFGSSLGSQVLSNALAGKGGGGGYGGFNPGYGTSPMIGRTIPRYNQVLQAQIPAARPQVPVAQPQVPVAQPRPQLQVPNGFSFGASPLGAAINTASFMRNAPRINMVSRGLAGLARRR